MGRLFLYFYIFIQLYNACFRTAIALFAMKALEHICHLRIFYFQQWYKPNGNYKHGAHASSNCPDLLYMNRQILSLR